MIVSSFGNDGNALLPSGGYWCEIVDEKHFDGSIDIRPNCGVNM